MPKRVKESLRRFKDIDVPLDEIARRSRLEPPPREMLESSPSRNRPATVAAAFLIFALAASLFFVPLLRSTGPSVTAVSPSGTESSAIGPLDPAAICNVPAYDPTITLLVGNETTAYPKAVLEGPGTAASELQGPATDDLRAYIASSAGQNAPEVGWRVIDSSADHVTFAAPPGYGYGEWWVVGFSQRDGRQWQRVQEEIVDQAPTPAERGHELSLTWTDDVIVRNGDWNDPLELVNDRSTRWSDQGTVWGQAHVFDTTTNQEVATDVYTVERMDVNHQLEPQATMPVPLALGGVLAPAVPGTYSIVACIPELGLASPVAQLNVPEDVVARDAYVITYQPGNGFMDALAGGVLSVKNGCLGLGDGGSHFTYLLLPTGYVVVTRGGKPTLIGPTGNTVAVIGDNASFGGGYVGLGMHLERGITVPAPCQDGRGYFLGY